MLQHTAAYCNTSLSSTTVMMHVFPPVLFLIFFCVLTLPVGRYISVVHASRCLTQYGRGGVGTDAACSMSSWAHWAGSRARRVQQVSANVLYATTLLCVHTALSAPKSLPPNDANFILTVDSKMLFVNTPMISGESQLEVGCEPPLRRALYIQFALHDVCILHLYR